MMKAIETVYKGYRFRSRKEARIAVMFDVMGLAWEYELEGYDLGNGVRYLPDFWLPGLDCFFEVKGAEPTEEEIDKIMRLVSFTGKDVFIASGDLPYREINDHLIPFDIDAWFDEHKNDDFSNVENLDMFTLQNGEPWRLGGGLSWVECPTCHKIGIKYFPDAFRADAFCPCVAPLQENSPRLVAAFQAARSARFEYGETGR